MEAVKLVNEAVRNLDHAQLYNALQNPRLELEKILSCQENSLSAAFSSPTTQGSRKIICEEDALHYLNLLRDVQRDRSLLVERQGLPATNGSGRVCELWVEDILEAIQIGLKNVNEAKSASFNLAIINMAVIQHDADHTYQILLKQGMHITAFS